MGRIRFIGAVICLAVAAVAGAQGAPGTAAQELALDQVRFSGVQQSVDVALSRFGSYTAVADTTEGNSVRVLDENWELLWRHRQPVYWGGTFRHSPMLQFAPDESFLVFPAFRTENDIALVDPKTGKPISVLSGHSDTVDCIALSPDAARMVSTSGREILLWKRSGLSYVIAERPAERGGAVQALAFSPDGTRVAAGETDDMKRRLVLYSVTGDTLKEISRYENPENNLGHEYSQLAFSPDGRWLAAGYSDSLMVFDTSAAKIRLAQTAADIELGPVISVSFSPDGALLWTGHVRDLRAWRMTDGSWREAATFTPHVGHVRAMRFSLDGTRLAIAGGADASSLGLWAVRGVAPSPLGRLLSLLGGKVSAAQRRFVDEDMARRILASLDPAETAPRDMFETEQEFTARQGRAGARAAGQLQEETEKRYGAERRPVTGALYEVSIPLQGQGTYAIDAKTYSLRFMDTDAIATLERDSARELYQNWQKARVRATRVKAGDGSTYEDFRIQLPLTAREVPIGLSENPFTGEALDRYGARVPATMIGPDLLVRGLQIEGLFPALYHSYSDRSLGTMTLQNTGSGTITDLSVRLFVPGLMKAPTDAAAAPAMAAGQSQEVSLRALFDPAVLDHTEAGTVTAELTLQYTSGGKAWQDTVRRPIGLLNRNAVRWTDDRKVGAFMSVNATGVLRFSGQVVGGGEEVATDVLTRDFLSAMRLFAALKAAGVRYVVDPSSPYETLSRDRAAVDFIRFPMETLDARSGDCDDLSVLYDSLLESVGVQTAYIVTPGHIFTAFNLGMSPEAAARGFGKLDDLVVKDGTVWMPVETTMINDGFVKAWQTAAAEWREAGARGTAGFFTTREAWQVYLPAGFAGPTAGGIPSEEKVTSLLGAEMDAFRTAVMAPREKEILGTMAASATPAQENSLGVLYAQFGLLSKALERFGAADDYVPALVNAASVFSLRKDPGSAQELLARAQKVQPDNPRVLAALAFVYLQAGNEAEARRAWDRVSRIAPDLSARYPLSGAGAGAGSARAGRADPAAQLFGADWLR